MKILPVLLCGCFLLPFLDAQVVLREVASTGTAVTVPHDPPVVVTLDGFAGADVDDFGSVTFTAGRRQNNSTIGRVAMLWDAGFPLLYLMGTNDTPPQLPVPTGEFLDNSGNPFDDPIANNVSLLPGRIIGAIALQADYRNAGSATSGTNWAGVAISQYGGAFLRETGTTALGLVGERAELIMTGSLFDPASERIGRAGAFGGGFETILERGVEIPALEAGESLGFLDRNAVKWNASGRLAYLGTIEGPGLGFPDNDGLFFEEADREDMAYVARDLDPHPSYPGSGLAPDGIFHDVGGFGALRYSINDRGEIAFVATITDPADPNGTVGSIWWQEDGPEIRAIVRTGTATQVAGHGPASFTGLSYPMLTEGGDIVYLAQWQDGGAFLNGLVRWQQSDDTHHLVIKKGDALDGTVAGLTLESIPSFDLKMTPGGRVFSKVWIRMPDNALRQAVIAQRTNGIFYVVAIVGEDLVLTDNTNLGIVTSVGFPPNTSINGMDGRSYGVSPGGRIALLVDATNEHLLAVDVDFTEPGPKPEQGVAAGRTDRWDNPTGFKEGLAQEQTRLEAKLALAMDTGVPVDVGALTGLTRSERATLALTGLFNRDDRAFALGYLKAQLNVLKAINLAFLRDPKLAAWLLESFRGGRVLFGAQGGSGIRSFAEIDSDASAEGGTEVITLRFLSTTELEVYDPDLVKLTNSLLHEARHAFQAFPGLDRTHTAAEQAAWAKGRHANELVASREELELVEDLIGGILGNDTGKLGQAVLGELHRNLSGAERDAARNRLLARLQEIRKNAQFSELCRDGYCEALQRFLDAGATSGAGVILTEELKRLRCFLLYRDVQNEFGRIGVFGGEVIYNSATQQLEPSNEIGQLDTNTGQETAFNAGNGAEEIHDAALSADGETLYVAAKTGTTGTVLSYSDTDGDGLFDASTEAVVVASASLNGGFYLDLNLSEDLLLAYAWQSGTVYGVDEDTAQLDPIGQLPPPQDPVLDFWTEDGFVTTSPMPRGETPAPGFFYRLAGYGSEGLGPEFDFSPFGNLERAATFGKAPVEGDVIVVATGRPGEAIELARAAGTGPFTSEAREVFDEGGTATLGLSTALGPAEHLRLIGGSTGEEWAEMPTWSVAKVSDELQALAESDRKLYIEAQGTPGGNYLAEWGPTVDSFGLPVPFQMGAFGTSVQSGEPDPGEGGKYFGRVSRPE